MFKWRKTRQNADGVATASPSAAVPSGINDGDPNELDGLDFLAAIKAHMRWKARLRAVIDGSSQEQISTTVLARDDQCPLGNWLHGPAALKFATEPLFRDLVEHHAEFHLHAAGVLDLAQQGDSPEALRALERGPYVQTSGQVSHLLAKLYLHLRSRNPLSARTPVN